VSILHKLVIAEKPSVAATIANVLGVTDKKGGYYINQNYIVTSCFGHLVGLAMPENYDEKYNDWNFETLPIIPEKWKFSVHKDGKERFMLIKKLMAMDSVDEIICATDAGREGECIFRYVYYNTGCKKPVKRLWVSSMTDEAMKKAFSDLRDFKQYDNLFSAGYARAKADWLVGLNATRVFSVRYKSSLSIGRVQTPTLAMIVQRDYEVRNFVKQKYFTVDLDCGDFIASSERIDDESTANAIAEKCNGKDALVSSIKKKVRTENPPLLYDLNTLQREANQKFGYTAKQTSTFAQSLYEVRKLMTYPRTLSKYITDDMDGELRKMVNLVCQYIPCCNGITVTSPDIQRNIDNEKVGDHHAILPTDNIAKFDLSTLPEGEMNILSLVASKVILAVSAPHKYEAIKAVLKCEETDFSATGKTVIQDGWKATDSRIKSMLKQDKAEDDEKVDTNINFAKALSALSEGQVINSVKPSTSEHWTTPPKPYTDDTLLKAMETAGNKDYDENADVEKKGIGTSATRADIIESLVQRQYVFRKKKQIFPTEKGIELINVVPDEVKNAKMTADWETELQSVEKGLCSAQSFIQKIEDFTRNLCSTYSSVADNAVFTKKAEGGATGKCPKCGSEVKKGKFGYYCTNKCGMNLSKVYGKVLTVTQLQHLLEGKQITYTVKDKKTIVLPEVEENNYQGKTYYQWKVKRNER